MKRVFVTPAAGFAVRDPLDPARRIATIGEVLLDSPALRRLEAAGDVMISDEAPAQPAPAPTSAKRTKE